MIIDDLFENFNEDELLITDVQFLGLKKKAWNFSRGSRTNREYLYPNDTVAVKDSYSYIMSEDNRQVVSIYRKVEWFDSEGVLRLEKDVSPELNIKNLQALNREIRQGRIDYLESAGLELRAASPYVPEPYKSSFIKAANSVPVIIKYYNNEIEDYIKHGTLDFERLLLDENNPIIIDLLESLVRPPDSEFPTGLNMKQSVIHQLKGALE